MTAISAARATQVSSFAAARSDPTLRQGSKGAAVKELQNLLRGKGHNIAADGDFGPKTTAAVKSFQSSRGLVADGVVGPKTWAALRSGGVSNPGTPAGGKQVTAYHNGKPSTITVVPVGNGQYMRADAAAKFKAMQSAARAAGVNLTATSGFRSMEQQRVLYQKYLNGTGNLAARPGYSNHQGGISMDIGGIGSYSSKAYNWMKNNAGKYGFQNDVRGEYWHWTFKG